MKRTKPESPDSVYFVECPATNAIKVGVSSNVAARVASLQTANSTPLTILLTIPGDREQESRLHGRFRHERVSGEWFRNDGDLRKLIAALCDLPEERRAEAIERAMFRPSRKEDYSHEYLVNEILHDACLALIRDKGVDYCAEQLSKRWSRQGRPVRVSTLQGVLEGRFNLRAEWLFWFRHESQAVADAIEFMCDPWTAQRDDAGGELARLRISLREEIGYAATCDLMRRARAR